MKDIPVNEEDKSIRDATEQELYDGHSGAMLVGEATWREIARRCRKEFKATGDENWQLAAMSAQELYRTLQAFHSKADQWALTNVGMGPSQAADDNGELIQTRDGSR